MDKNKKLDLYIEIALVFVLGILAGVALKVEANKFITIGFDDYKMKFSADGKYNINELQERFSEANVVEENVDEKNEVSSEKNVDEVGEQTSE